MRSAFRLTVTLATVMMFMLMFEQDVDARCDYTWESFGRHCYKYFEKTVTHLAAQTTCKHQRSYLVEISSEEENSYIRDFLQKKGVESVHMGITDIHYEGHWAYITTWTRVKYTHWYPGEPNNLGEEDCAVIEKNGHWNDISCISNYPFICEK
ncbi:hepatic lectin-like isoform X2 [Pomacea canaliculata]|uniref:hepatic lectin-like isoform X2 n=1 Tax=Pomacea canaliculata TaxID=400727 RepID=UPI000D72A79D|nr:hepatic lectin-like isoform X2 [Pomacea canaliculata]